MWTLPNFKVGDLLEVRSPEEILATLDEQGALAGMPFMPEMLQFCGRKFTVAAVAHKTCDTVTRTGGRKLDRMVHLQGTRCDGSAHGGCEADCNLFWREEWLKRVSCGPDSVPKRAAPFASASARACTESALRAVTQIASAASEPPLYSCQATRLLAASRPLAWWNVRQYWHDVRTGNHQFTHALRVLSLASVHRLMSLPFGYRVFNAIYSWLHRRLTGRPAPPVTGVIPKGVPTPIAVLGLKPGELVRVKTAAQIAATLSVSNRNRGLWFDPEDLPFCGGIYSVRRQITRIIDERSGRMLTMRTPCVSLEGVSCPALYSAKRMLCPRAITTYWREIYLERVASAAMITDGTPTGANNNGPR
jgi:hypothetical protein